MMAIRSQKEIYQVLEKHLKSIDVPHTCVALMDVPEIRAAALAEYGKDVRVATNKVSDALGLMWRRGLITKYPAPSEQGTLSRYAYIWPKAKQKPSPETVSPLPSLQGKTGVNITETDGGVLIEFDKFTVFVKPK